MVSFLISGHSARNDSSFQLNDLPGSGGRMDLLCRCVQASLFLSHGIRTDAVCYLILSGGPQTSKIVQFTGSSVKRLSPDERNIASFIKKALEIPAGSQFREVMPGLSVRKGSLADLLPGGVFGVLDENGTDIRGIGGSLPEGYILSDNLNFTPEEEDLIRDLPRFSLGPEVLHADHAIVLLHNERDRRMNGWI